MVAISSGASEQTPSRCPVCDADVYVPQSNESSFDAPCPSCGSSLFFSSGDLLYARVEALESKIQWQSVDELMPESVAHESRIVPLWSFGARVIIGMDHYDAETVEKIWFILNREIQVVVISADELNRLRSRMYKSGEEDEA